jgi:AcrR family transcriptional regulator
LAGHKKSRREQAEDTKLLIFNAALRLLDEMGFEKITVRDIVKAAEVSIGTFYYHYASKLDVFYETYYLADRYFEEKVAPLLTQASACERILRFFEHYAEYCSDLTSLALTSILFNSENKRFDRDKSAGILRILPELMSYGQENGELADFDTPYEMSRFFMISVRGLVYDWCTHDGAYDLKAAVGRHVERLLRCYKRR